MLPSHSTRVQKSPRKDADDDQSADGPRQTLKILEQKTNYWRQFRPELHKKTFFKGAQSLTMGIENSLNLKDETAREIVKDAFKIVG